MSCHEYGNFHGMVYEQSSAGFPPVITEVTDDNAEREAVRKLLHELVHENSVQPENIVILGWSRFEKSIFSERPKLGNFVIVDSLESGGRDEIRYATVYRFKGLEADCVILTGIDPEVRWLDEQQQQQMLYVAASRAKKLLYIFHRPGIDLTQATVSDS